MKKEIHKSEQRGKSELGWLHSRFSFSFADYYNPKRIGFGKLLVFNDDIIEPGYGFGSHFHSNMEIISIPIEGGLAHKDSTGVKEVIKVGEIQVMSAGSGVVHSEYNNSKKEPGKFFQIWIETKKHGIKPRYDKKKVNIKKNLLELVVSGNESDKVLYINQNAKIYLGKFDKNKTITHKIDYNNGVFVFLIEGSLDINGNILNNRDSIEIREASEIILKTISDSYFIIIEVPMK